MNASEHVRLPASRNRSTENTNVQTIRRKIALVLALILLAPPLSPAGALARRCQPAGTSHYGGYSDYDYFSDGYYDDYDDDCDWYNEYDDDDDDVDEALLWGLGGLVLGSLLLSAAMNEQPAQATAPEMYGPPQPQVYNYPPPVPPGMCRWERYVLDSYGANVLDQYGQPVKEYTLGSCQFPPN